MNWPTLLAVAVGLAMDALAVAIATGLTLRAVTPRHTFRLAFHFGLFQFLMPVIGWWAGRRIALLIGDADHWIAFGLLGLIGGKMIWEAFCDDEPGASLDPTRGWMLVTLSLATSMDALAVGMSMALLGTSIWLPSIVIGLVAATLTALGLVFGNRLGKRWGFWAEIGGGALLLLIGLRILIEHLSA